MPVFIDPTRSTNGAGTFADPRNTWSGITWSAGEQYLQKEGTTFSGTVIVGASGTAGSEIVLGTYDAITGARITDNTRHASIESASGMGIATSTRTDIIIDNLRVVGGNAANQIGIQAVSTNSTTAQRVQILRCRVFSQPLGSHACQVRGLGSGVYDSYFEGHGTGRALYCTAQDLTIEGNTIVGVSGTALHVSTTAGLNTTPLNVVIRRNTVRTTDAAGATYAIFAKGRNIVVRENTVDRADGDAVLVDGQEIVIEDNRLSGFDAKRENGDGIQVVGSHDMLFVRVCRNTVVGHTEAPVKQCILVGDAGAAIQTTPAIVAENYCYGMATGIIAELPGTMLRRNRVRATVGDGIFLQAANCQASVNVIEDAGAYGIGVKTGDSGCAIENNHLVSCQHGINLSNTNTTVRNNYVNVASEAVRSSAATAVLSNNAYSGAASWVWSGISYSTLAAYQAASSQDSNSLTGDLQTTTDGRPLPGSPLLTGGADLGLRRDIRGYLSRKHIGAFGAARLVRP